METASLASLAGGLQPDADLQQRHAFAKALAPHVACGKYAKAAELKLVLSAIKALAIVNCQLNLTQGGSQRILNGRTLVFLASEHSNLAGVDATAQANDEVLTAVAGSAHASWLYAELQAAMQQPDPKPQGRPGKAGGRDAAPGGGGDAAAPKKPRLVAVLKRSYPVQYCLRVVGLLYIEKLAGLARPLHACKERADLDKHVKTFFGEPQVINAFLHSEPKEFGSFLDGIDGVSASDAPAGVDVDDDDDDDADADGEEGDADEDEGEEGEEAAEGEAARGGPQATDGRPKRAAGQDAAPPDGYNWRALPDELRHQVDGKMLKNSYTKSIAALTAVKTHYPKSGEYELPTTVDQILTRLKEKQRLPKEPMLGAILYLWYCQQGDDVSARLLRELSDAASWEAGSESDKVGLVLRKGEQKDLNDATKETRLAAAHLGTQAALLQPVITKLDLLVSEASAYHTERMAASYTALAQQRHANVTAARGVTADAALATLKELTPEMVGDPILYQELREKALKALSNALDPEDAPPIPSAPPPRQWAPPGNNTDYMSPGNGAMPAMAFPLVAIPMPVCTPPQPPMNGEEAEVVPATEVVAYGPE